MPNITTHTDYVNEPWKIPGAVSENAGEPENKGLTNIITESERTILKEILGDAQYATLQTELGKLPFNASSSETADEDYQDLVNGDGSFVGLINLLKNYVFCEYLRETEVNLSLVGSGKGQSQGFTVADNNAKFAKRWNAFVLDLEYLGEWLDDHETLEQGEDFPTYERENRFGL